MIWSLSQIILFRYWHLDYSNDRRFEPLRPWTPFLWHQDCVPTHPRTYEHIRDGNITVVQGEATYLERLEPENDIKLGFVDQAGNKGTIVADGAVFATGFNIPVSHSFIRPDLAPSFGLPGFQTKESGDGKTYEELDREELERILGHARVLRKSPNLENVASGGKAPVYRLFRGIVPVELFEDRNIHVCGWILSLNKAIPIQLQAAWIADYFKGSFINTDPTEYARVYNPETWGRSRLNSILTTFPSKETVKRETAARSIWARLQLGPLLGAWGLLIIPHGPRYSELLLRDMGLAGFPECEVPWMNPLKWDVVED